MKSFLRKQSIKVKLILIIMLTSIVSLLMTGAIFIIYEQYYIKQDLVGNISALGKLIADRSTAALTFQDSRLAEENLSALHIKPSIVAACIFNDKGEVFAKYNARGSESIDFPVGGNNSGHRFENGYLMLFEPINLGGEQIGTVFICTSLKEFYTQRQFFILLVGVIILFSSLIAFFLSSRLQVFISKPLSRLTETTKLIATKKDYSLRAEKNSDDEVGILVSAFNEMLEMIEKQNIDLKEREAHYRFLFEQNPMPMLIYELDSLIILAVNDAFVAHYGYSKTEASALHLTDLYPESEKKAIADLIKTLHGHAYVGEWHHLKKDGTQITIEPRSHGFSYEGRAARIAVINDITERKQAEEKLRQSEEQFRLISENVADMIAVLDLQGRRIYNNPSYTPILGDVQSLSGTDSFLEIHPDDREKIKNTFQETVITGKGQRAEYRFIAKDGSIHFIESQGSVIRNEEGNVANVVVVSRDITSRKKAEEELQKYRKHLEEMVKERTAELVIAKERAESADQLKSAFLATMSHELRTPLNSIIGFTGILIQGLAGPLNNEQTKQLGMVQNSAHHLLALINDVLDISKIEAGQLEVALKCFDFHKSIEKIISSIQPLTERKGLELQTNISPEVSELVSDSRRVEQILLNLLNNAIKFTEKGSIHVECKIVDKMLVTSITDTGIGIRDEDLEKLFKPFSQIDTGTTRTYEGTGLGLSICKKLVEKLGGNITVQSKVGTGSTFRVALPIIEG